MLRVLVTPSGLADLDLQDHVCVVVDVLRACTTVAHALEAGARGIIPVDSVEEASRLATTLDRDTTLLCGERGGVRVEGFDLGNSPTEYTPEIVDGKTLVYSTSNGAPVMAILSRARECIAGSFVTMGACARRVAAEERVAIVCAGSGSGFSLEDFLCAGMLIDEIVRLAPPGRELDDGARTAHEVFRLHAADPLGLVRATDHGRSLAALGFEQDLALACEIDRFSFVPTLRDGRLVSEELPAAS